MTLRRRILFGALAASVLLLTGCTSAAEPRIDVAEAAGSFAPLELRVTGLEPGAEVTLTAAADVDGAIFDSAADFIADPNGVIDLSAMAPTSGSWSTADSMGPFWSLSSVYWRSLSAFDEPYDVDLVVVDSSGAAIAEVTVARPGTAPGVEERSVTDAGFIGSYVLPAGDTAEPRPAALVLGGSEGGLESAKMTAHWIASLGYPALAVAYFDEPGQPTTLQNVPVDPVLVALEWLHGQEEVDTDALFTFGISRGGELALWLAARHPELVAGAFAPVGSGYLVCGFPDFAIPAWTLDGTALSTECMNDMPPPTAAAVDVAAIDGPVVLACGGEDELWPSCLFMDDIVERRGDAQTIALPGEGASHNVALPPGMPAMDRDVPVEVHSATHAVRTAFWDAAAEVLAASGRD